MVIAQLATTTTGATMPTLLPGSNSESQGYSTLFDSDLNALWGWLDSPHASCFNLPLIQQIERFDDRLAQHHGQMTHAGHSVAVYYYVLASRDPQAFSHGGDLAYFCQCIERADREALLAYATQCIDVIYRRLRHYESPRLITVSLLQGDALGGGLEFAMTSDIVIAEAHVKMGLPETRFNLFPGMGAHSLLSRRVGRRLTEQMMLSGQLYRADTLLEMGVIDRIVPSGQGVDALNAYLTEHHPRHNSHAAIFQARQAVWPVTREELMTITQDWVDAALRLQSKELDLMARIAQRQTHRRRST